MYFASSRTGTFQIWKTSVVDGKVQQFMRDGGFEAFESPDGKILFHTKGAYVTPGLWSMPAEGGKEVGLPQLSTVLQGYWAMSDLGIYFVDFSGLRLNEPVPLNFFEFQTQKVLRIGVIE